MIIIDIAKIHHEEAEGRNLDQLAKENGVSYSFLYKKLRDYREKNGLEVNRKKPGRKKRIFIK